MISTYHRFKSVRSIAVSLSLATALCIAVMSRPGHASYVGTPFQGERPGMFELHVGMAYYDFGMASGGRFGIPIVDNGFIQTINNAVFLSLGADFYLVKYRDEPHGALGIPIALHWEFYFTEKWSAYGEAGSIYFFIHPFFRGTDGPDRRSTGSPDPLAAAFISMNMLPSPCMWALPTPHSVCFLNSECWGFQFQTICEP
jgi:hypothetical protein